MKFGGQLRLREEVDRWVANRLVAFGETARWSSLARLGESSMVRLTILVPFIGYMIIFNEYVQKFISLSIRWTKNGSAHLDVSTPSLYFLYFGLLLLGIASFFYALFAPSQIKNHPMVADYIKYMNGISTDNLARASLERVMEIFLSRDEEKRHPMFGFQSLSFPYPISNTLHGLVSSIYRDSTFSKDNLEQEVDAWPEGEEHLVELHTGSGYLRTDHIIERMAMNRRFDWAFVDSMFESALKKTKDIYHIEHVTLDYSRFPIRSTILILYSIGFILLFVPTATLSMRIIQVLLNGAGVGFPSGS
jgi:hypothetical protein